VSHQASEHASEHASRAVRWVAALEAAKGFLVVLAGTALLRLLHDDAQRTAEALVRHLHLNPAREVPRVFLEAAGRLTTARLRWLALGAAGYATVRFLEAYGLWHGRRWARLFGALTGAIYVPFELAGLARHPTPLGLAALAVNVLVVLVLWRSRTAAPRDRSAPAP
jgi:uncharacterized membrane protein (DUF2068 family)